MTDKSKSPETLRAEMRAVFETASTMLGGSETGDGETDQDHGPEMQRITLMVPTAHVYAATYLAIAEQGQGGEEIWKHVESGRFPLNGRVCREHWRPFFEDMINTFMADHLHRLAIGTHSSVIVEGEDAAPLLRNTAQLEDDPFDDGFPF